MGFLDNFKRTQTEQPQQRTKKDLSPEEIEEIEALLSEGTPVSVVAREYNVSSPALYILRRNMQGIQTTPISPPRGRPSVNPDVDAIQQEIALLKAQSALDKAKEEMEYEREMRKLSLEEKRLEIQQRRAELYDDDDDDEELDIAEAASDPQAAMWQFFAQILKKQMSVAPQSAVSVTPDAVEAPRPASPNLAIDQTLDAIKLEMEISFTPEQLIQASKMPKAVLHSHIKGNFPGITENNLKHIDQILATYGQ